MAGAIRNPAVAGQFYAGNEKGLDEQVRGCLEDVKEKVDALGVVSPHAGFMYSGKVAGAVYSRITMPDTFVILGPNHHGMGADYSIMTEGVWNLPFGQVKVDDLLAKEIFRNCAHLKDDPFAQEAEHSLEVQVPFMQYFRPDIQIVPISMRHYLADDAFLKVCTEIGDSIGEVAARVGSRVTVVASTDFTHYQSQETASDNDHAALEAIVRLDAGELFREVRERDISMCGYAPVAATIAACRKLGATKAELVKYMTSGDTTGDYSAVVGYGGIVITK